MKRIAAICLMVAALSCQVRAEDYISGVLQVLKPSDTNGLATISVTNGLLSTADAVDNNYTTIWSLNGTNTFEYLTNATGQVTNFLFHVYSNSVDLKLIFDVSQ